MKQTQALQIFKFENHEIRTIIINGEPWWIAKDVCTTLDIVDHTTAVNRLDEDEKGTHTIGTPGGLQQMLCVNESGVYHLIFTSRKPVAQTFRKWVTNEVLPSIRKTGSYIAPGVHLQPAFENAQLESIVAKLLEEVAQLRSLIKPKARPLSLQKENARSRVFRYLKRLETQTGQPVTARNISRYCTKIPVAVIRAYLQEGAEQKILEETHTSHAVKYSFIKQ